MRPAYWPTCGTVASGPVRLQRSLMNRAIPPLAIAVLTAAFASCNQDSPIDPAGRRDAELNDYKDL